MWPRVPRCALLRNSLRPDGDLQTLRTRSQGSLGEPLTLALGRASASRARSASHRKATECLENNGPNVSQRHRHVNPGHGLVHDRWESKPRGPETTVTPTRRGSVPSLEKERQDSKASSLRYRRQNQFGTHGCQGQREERGFQRDICAVAATARSPAWGTRLHQATRRNHHW